MATPMKLRAAVDLYTSEDAVYRGYAASTQRNYARTLDMLCRVTPSQVNACDLRVEHVDRCLKELSPPQTPEEIEAREKENAARARVGESPRSGRSQASLSNDIKAIKAFIKFLHRRELMALTRNPALHLKSNPDRTPKTTLDQIIIQPDDNVTEKLLEAAGNRHPRDRAVVALGLWAGLRESEMLALRISGVAFDNTVVEDGRLFAAPEIRVYREKNDSWHVVPMHHRLEDELRQYFRWLETKCGPLQRDWFVVGSRLAGVTKLTRDGRHIPDGGPLHQNSPVDPTRPAAEVAPDVQAALKNAGFGKLYRSGAHTLRRMAAVEMQNRTGDIRNAMALLGHGTQATTEGYLRHSPGTTRIRKLMRGWASEASTPQVADNVVPFRPRAAAG